MIDEKVVGTDVDVNWTLNPEGDLSLVQGSDNLAQAIYLRLTCYLNNLDYFYSNYGSTLKDWFGKNQNPYTRKTLIDEIKSRVLLDPRIEECQVVLEDWHVNMIGVHIDAKLKDDTNFEEFFIFSNLRKEEEYSLNPNYRNTHIRTRKTYYAKQGQLLTVSAMVLDEKEKRVPIGEVSIQIGNYFVDVDDLKSNVKMVEQSGSDEPGTVTFKFNVPEFIELGDHELIFKYKGIYGYNSCSKTVLLKVVDRLPTNTQFVYDKKEFPYYYANDVDVFTDPIVYVDDFNQSPVTMGTVEYYIDTDDVYGERLVVYSPLIFLDDELINVPVILRTTPDLLEYSCKFMFDLYHRYFHNKDVFPLYHSDGETIIDVLECIYTERHYFLQTTTKNVNCNIKLVVIE